MLLEASCGIVIFSLLLAYDRLQYTWFRFVFNICFLVLFSTIIEFTSYVYVSIELFYFLLPDLPCKYSHNLRGELEFTHTARYTVFSGFSRGLTVLSLPLDIK